MEIKNALFHDLPFVVLLLINLCGYLINSSYLYTFPSMDHSLVMPKRLVWLNEAMSLAGQDHPRLMDHRGEFWQNMATGEGNSKPLQFASHKNPMTSMKRQIDMTLEEWAVQVGRCPICYWGRMEGNYKQIQKEWSGLVKAEMMPVGDVFGGQSKVWCCKEQYFIGTWNVMSMNQGKLDMVK